MIAVAAVVWIDTDGRFKVSNHDYFEQAEEYAELLGEEGIPSRVLYRKDFLRDVTS